MALRAAGLVCMAIALVVAACGGDGSDNGEPPEATATAPTDSPEATARPDVEVPTATPDIEVPTTTPDEVVGDGGGTEADDGTSVDAEIRAAIERPYELVSDERWEDLWNTYTSDFRARCSFDAMVQVFSELRATGVVRLEVSEFDEVEVVGDTAQVTYSVDWFDENGQRTASNNYFITMVKENGEWLAEEVCY